MTSKIRGRDPGTAGAAPTLDASEYAFDVLEVAGVPKSTVCMAPCVSQGTVAFGDANGWVVLMGRCGLSRSVNCAQLVAAPRTATSAEEAEGIGGTLDTTGVPTSHIDFNPCISKLCFIEGTPILLAACSGYVILHDYSGQGESTVLRIAGEQSDELVTALHSMGSRQFAYGGTSMGTLFSVNIEKKRISTYEIRWDQFASASGLVANSSHSQAPPSAPLVALEARPDDSSVILCGFANGILVEWNLEKRMCMQCHGIGKPNLTCVSWHVSGKKFAAGYSNGEVCVWRAQGPSESGPAYVAKIQSEGAPVAVRWVLWVKDKHSQIVAHAKASTKAKVPKSALVWLSKHCEVLGTGIMREADALAAACAMCSLDESHGTVTSSSILCATSQGALLAYSLADRQVKVVVDGSARDPKCAIVRPSASPSQRIRRLTASAFAAGSTDVLAGGALDPRGPVVEGIMAEGDVRGSVTVSFLCNSHRARLGEVQRAPVASSHATPTAVDVDASSGEIAVGYDDGTVAVFTLGSASGEVALSYGVPGKGSACTTLLLCRAVERVVAGFADGRVRVLSLHSSSILYDRVLEAGVAVSAGSVFEGKVPRSTESTTTATEDLPLPLLFILLADGMGILFELLGLANQPHLRIADGNGATEDRPPILLAKVPAPSRSAAAVTKICIALDKTHLPFPNLDTHYGSTFTLWAQRTRARGSTVAGESRKTAPSAANPASAEEIEENRSRNVATDNDDVSEDEESSFQNETEGGGSSSDKAGMSGAEPLPQAHTMLFVSSSTMQLRALPSYQTVSSTETSFDPGFACIAKVKELPTVLVYDTSGFFRHYTLPSLAVLQRIPLPHVCISSSFYAGNGALSSSLAANGIPLLDIDSRMWLFQLRARDDRRINPVFSLYDSSRAVLQGKGSAARRSLFKGARPGQLARTDAMMARDERLTNERVRATIERSKQVQAQSKQALANAAEARDALLERGEQLARLSERTGDMERHAGDFLDTIRGYNNSQRNKRWYQL